MLDSTIFIFNPEHRTYKYAAQFIINFITMITLSPSEKAVVAHINQSAERYKAIGAIKSETIIVDQKTLTKDEVTATLGSLRNKGIIEYTGVKEDLVYILHSKLPQ